MKITRWTITCVLAAGMLVVQPSTAVSQTAADLFSQDTVHEIRLYIHSKDLQQLRTQYLENVYYTADLVWRGIRVRNAAVRVRGRASRSATKPGLRVDFDRFVTNQRFLGLRSLVLDNGWQDPSMLREALSMAVFEKMGLPAVRESFCRLYINNVDHGLYVIVEAVEPEFLMRTFQENSGYLFEYHYPSDFYYGQDLGDDFAAYRTLFEPRTHRLEADTMLYSPIRDLFREVNQPVDAVWRERVERLLDLNAFVAQMAVDAYLSDWDGIVGSNGMNNFYLYRLAGGSVHRFIPWDKDNSLTDPRFPVFGDIEAHPLARNALSFPDLRELYFDVLRECVRVSIEDGWFAREVERLSTLISAAAYADRLKPFSNEEVEATLQGLLQFASERPPIVLQAIDSAQGQPQQ